MSPPSRVLWFTGLPCSGKSTVADCVRDELVRRGLEVERLDGDTVRETFPSTGFTREDRDMHIKRIGFLASRLEAHGIFVVASFVSPYREARQYVRGLCRDFVEIYVSTSAAECEKRDVKGMYRKARAGEIRHFTGVDDPYEPPEHPELAVDTTGQAVDETVAIILRYLGLQDRPR